jgi:hypothetical protein
MKKEFENIDDDKLSIKEIIFYSAGGLIILGGGFFLIREIVLKLIANREEKKTFEDGSPATFAKQIKMAFENDGWMGTNTIALRNTLREIPDKNTFDKVINSYQKLYNSSMLFDMSDELQSSEYNEMLQIINAKPKKKGQALSSINYNAWAKRLKAAFDKTYGFISGTDEEAIKAVFYEIPNRDTFLKTALEYQKLFQKNIITDLKDELDSDDYTELMLIIARKPKN